MRWIRKRGEPRELTEYRRKNQKEPEFGYFHMRRFPDVIQAVETSLLIEQGWLCAYTGRALNEDNFHVEHVKAQAHSTPAETVAYTNMVACYPGHRYRGKYSYGAHQKEDWPAPGHESDFVSPLDPSCEHRFHYAYSGRISPTDPSDMAAKTTIDELNLDDKNELGPDRHNAIRGALQPKGTWLTLEQAERVLKQCETPADGKLPAFQFVVAQALRNHIANLKARRTRRSDR